MVKVGLFAVIIGGLFFLFNKFTGEEGGSLTDIIKNWELPGSDENENTVNSSYYRPKSSLGQQVHHKYYSLSYSEEHEQAEWVAYKLSRELLEQHRVEREDQYLADPLIRTESAQPNDYRGSGYDRGHLAPAADMAFSEEAMRETFFMSNMSPQSRNFNMGIWKELEELTRIWAKKYKNLYVVTGPILSEPKGEIGKSTDISVPRFFFKVLLDVSEPELKGIGFIIPNQVSFTPLYEYAHSIDEVENATGFDFFFDSMDNQLEEELERNFNNDLWYYSKQKHELRVNKWNHWK